MKFSLSWLKSVLDTKADARTIALVCANEASLWAELRAQAEDQNVRDLENRIARDVRVAPLLGGCMCIHRATKC